MSKSRIITIIMASTALLFGLIFFQVTRAANTLKGSEVYTWDCEIPDQKPQAITITCGDGGQYIDGIKWDSWGASGAQGTGTYHVNDCEPNCAEGNFLSATVTVELSNLTTYKGKSYLRTLDFKTLDGTNLPHSGQSFYQWDVMEFAEAMAE